VVATFAQNLTADLRSEAELLLCCAQTRVEPDAEKRISLLLKKKIDWNYLIYAAFNHGTLPLLSWHLSRLPVMDVPEAIQQQLRNMSNAIARLNLLLTGELLTLLSLLRDRGIPALPVKGPVLAAAAYRNVSLRQFCDLDILVSKPDMLQAKEVLLQRGYEPALQLSASEERAYVETHHDYKFTRDRDGIVVELQWGITQWSFAFPLDFDEMWARHVEFVLAGQKVPTLAPEDLLLVLCVHGAKHKWEQLKWICDIAEVITAYRQKIDWDRLMVRARALGGKRMLLLGLYLSHDLLDTNLPDQVLKTIQDDLQIERLAGQVNEGLFRKRPRSNELRDERPLFYWRVRERLRDKLAIAWRYFPEYLHRMVVPNERDRARVRLPGFLSVGYYLVRPVRLLKEHWPRLRGLCRDAGKSNSERRQ
jgi:hypothetical protein